MNLYLDDDSIAVKLTRILRNAGHDLLLPADLGLSGVDDSVHLAHAVRHGRIMFSMNHDDFQNLHDLVLVTGGVHPGILIVRKDNDPTRDMSHRGIVVALKNLEAANFPLRGEFVILNHWR